MCRCRSHQKKRKARPSQERAFRVSADRALSPNLPATETDSPASWTDSAHCPSRGPDRIAFRGETRLVVGPGSFRLFGRTVRLLGRTMGVIAGGAEKVPRPPRRTHPPPSPRRGRGVSALGGPGAAVLGFDCCPVAGLVFERWVMRCGFSGCVVSPCALRWVSPREFDGIAAFTVAPYAWRY